jgi:hypothetical protein
MSESTELSTDSSGALPQRSRTSRIVEDGILSGVIGAAAVALWFLLLDIARGQPFFTPSLLGNVLFLSADVSDVTSASALIVLAYTGLHGLLFLVAGVVLAFMVWEFEQNPQLGLVLLLLFVLFESVVFGLEVTVVPNLVGALGAGAVAFANVLAAGAMFWFLIARNPGAMQRLRDAWNE